MQKWRNLEKVEFKNTEVWGFKHALHGIRNAMESWNKSDSGICEGGDNGIGCDNCAVKEKCQHFYDKEFKIGKKDMELAQSLLRAGNADSKFMRMIHVAVDVNMPRYWHSEADTYHFNTKNSCSTMHKLLNNNKPITLDMFTICDEDLEWWKFTVDRLEELRREYKRVQSTTKDPKQMNRLLVRAKRMLPEGFLQMRTWDTNYAELRNMYFQRRHHKLKEEWVDTFCKWIESLPYAKELIMYEKYKGE